MSFDKVEFIVSDVEAKIYLLKNISESTQGRIVFNNRDVPPYYSLLLSKYKNNSNIEFLINDGVEKTCGVVNESRILSYVGGSNPFVEEKDPEKVKSFQEEKEKYFEESKELRARAPTPDKILQTSTEELGEDIAKDILEFSEEFPEVEISKILILLGAEYELLLYDISKWAEDTGLCSKATVSRHHDRLRDEFPQLQKERVPIDIGRPRRRLKLNGKAKNLIAQI